MLAPYLSKSTTKKHVFFWVCFNHPTMRIPVWKFGKCKKPNSCHGFHPSEFAEAQNSSSSSPQLSIAGDEMISMAGSPGGFPMGWKLLACLTYPTKLMAFVLGGGLGILRNIYYINIWYIYYTLPETNIAQVIRFCWWAGFSWLFKMHYGLAHVYGCFQK